MSAPQLLRHGENIKPHYAPQPGQTENWAGKSTDEERRDGNTSGIVKRYVKHTKASEMAASLGLISRASTDAIRYSSPAETGLRGLALLNAVTFVAMFGAAALWRSGSPYLNWLDYLLSIALLIFLVWLVTWSVRLELFQPIDQPTIFDRKHRKVYRIFSEAQPGWKGLLKRWPMRAVEYDWDLIDVEHNATIVTTGSTIRREHTLIFIVRKSANDPTIIDSFNIGNSLFAIDDAVDEAWEHIRRFMEDNGPPLPYGEALPEPSPRKTLWARIRDVTPLGKAYWEWWREQFPIMLLAHVLLPLSVVFIGLWVFFGWLAIKTSKSIQWPPEVIAAVGPEVAAPMTNHMV